MNNPHPITPPPELIEKVSREAAAAFPDDEGDAGEVDEARDEYIAKFFTQWGADMELEACCEYLLKQGQPYTAAELRATRRSKPPTLKQQAFKALDAIEGDFNTVGDRVDTIRRALEQLPDD